MRFTILSACASLAAALLVPASTAIAVGEICQGQPATIVGMAGQPLVGTEGPDVIVTNGATNIDALGGDDLVCVTGLASSSPIASVDAGSGDDVVEVGSPNWRAWTVLGEGDDTFVATNSQHHGVWAGTRHLVDAETPFNDAETADTGADVVRAQSATVYNSGAAGQPNADVIELGSGIVHWQGRQVTPGRVSFAQTRRSTLAFNSMATRATLNARAGTMSASDTSLDFPRVGRYQFSTTVERGRVTFRGSNQGERLDVHAPMAFNRVINMGPGKDTYQSNGTGGKSSRVYGGRGKDTLLLDMRDYKVKASMGGSRYVATRGGVRIRNRVGGFERLTLAAKRADVTGTNRSDYIHLMACQVRVRAKKGKDFIGVDPSDDSYWEPMTCSASRAVIFGGRGNDTIVGGPGNDRLIGGPGKDIVDGDAGRDVCQGEKVYSCEKRL